VLAHGLRMSDYILDLLFFPHNRSISKLTNDDFDETCKMLLNRYKANLNSLHIDFFSGFTENSFETFLDKHRVEEILIPKSYAFENVTASSFDLLPFIKSSPYKVRVVNWQPVKNVPEKSRQAENFSYKAKTVKRALRKYPHPIT
jgi:hypothetical protein